jgi:hypothetical protein
VILINLLPTIVLVGYNFSRHYQLDQIINELTRVTRTSASLIDLFFTNRRESISQSGVIHLGLSDHSMIYAVRKFIVPKSDPKIKIIRNFKNFNANDFLTNTMGNSYNIQ